MPSLSSEFWHCQRKGPLESSFLHERKGHSFRALQTLFDNTLMVHFQSFFLNEPVRLLFQVMWFFPNQVDSSASANNKRHPCLTYYLALQTMFHYGRTVLGSINCPWELILSSPPERLPLQYSCLNENFTAYSISRNQSVFWKHKEYRLDRIWKACKIYTYCPSKLASVIQSFPFGDYVRPYTHILFPQRVTVHTLREGQEIFSMLFVLTRKGYCLAKDE